MGPPEGVADSSYDPRTETVSSTSVLGAFARDPTYGAGHTSEAARHKDARPICPAAATPLGWRLAPICKRCRFVPQFRTDLEHQCVHVVLHRLLTSAGRKRDLLIRQSFRDHS